MQNNLCLGLNYHILNAYFDTGKDLKSLTVLRYVQKITLSVNVRKGCSRGCRLVRQQPIRLKWFYYIYLSLIKCFYVFMEIHPFLFEINKLGNKMFLVMPLLLKQFLPLSWCDYRLGLHYN